MLRVVLCLAARAPRCIRTRHGGVLAVAGQPARVAARLNTSATRHAVAFACVLAAHLAVLVVLISITRTRSIAIAGDERPLLWILLAPRAASPAAALPPLSRPQAQPLRSPESANHADAAPPIAQPDESRQIDWTEEARSTAIHEAEHEDDERRRAEALAPPKSALFAPRSAPRPAFGWYHAGTHRIEPLAGGLLINLSDQCALVLLPFPLAGCALGRVPARSDLFGQMHDQPEFGAWKER